MSFPNPNENVGGVLQGNAAQWRAYLMGVMRNMGIDPSRNIYANQAIERAPEAQWLAQMMNVGDTGIQDFGRQWVNARLGQGGQYGGVDLSRGGMTNWLQGAMRSNDPNSLQYKMFNTGNPETDYANLGSAMGIMQGGYSPMAQRAEQQTLSDWYMKALGQMQQAGPTVPTNLLDYFYGRANAGQGTPQGATPGLPPGAPAYATPNAPATPGSPAQPALPAAPAAPGAPAPGAPAPAAASITNWQQLLDRYRADERNWGTEGFRPNPGAFTIGGISYNPAQDLVTDWENMSASGRTTHRGNMMSQFLRYLQVLMNQRNNQGNAALGITRATTDDQLARIAAERMGRHAVGSTGLTVRTGAA